MPRSRTGRTPTDRYVAFIDILGFANATRRLLANPAALRQCDATLRRCIQWAGGAKSIRPSPPSDWWCDRFGDSIFFSQRADTLGLLNLLDGAAAVQRELIGSGFLVRGAIARGRIAGRGRTVVSDAIVRAVEIEKLIELPVIAVDLSVIDALREEPDSYLRRELGEMLALDTRHGFGFVSPYIFNEDDEWLGGHRFYEQARDLIATGLKRSRSRRLRQKYEWAAEFHNWNIGTAKWQHFALGSEAMCEDQCWDYRSLRIAGVATPSVFTAVSREFDKLGTRLATSSIPVFSMERSGDLVFDTEHRLLM